MLVIIIPPTPFISMIVVIVGNSGKNGSPEHIYEEVSPREPNPEIAYVIREENELGNMTANAAYPIHPLSNMNVSQCEAYGIHDARM